MENQPVSRAREKFSHHRAVDPPVHETRRRTEEDRPTEDCTLPAAQHMALLGEEFAACSALLVALGNESRQAIFLDLLRNWGGLRTYEIAEHVGLSKPTVSHHLGVMKKAGIVSMKRIGTMQIYHPSESMEPWKALSQLAWKAYRFVKEEVLQETCPKASVDAGGRTRKDDRWT